MSRVVSELFQAFRRWRTRPAFAVTAVITLALGIGVTTAIFSVVDSVLLRPLPWREPERLAVPWIVRPEWLQNPVLVASADRGVLSWPNVRELQAQNRTLESVAIWSTVRPLIQTSDAGGASEQTVAMRVSSTFLDTLGVQPMAGRNFTPNEDDDPSDAAIISYEAWQRRFGGDPQILERRVTLDEASRTIVGVLPPRFRFEGDPPEFLLPVGEADKRFRTRGNHNYRGLVRLKPGVTLEEAHGDTEPILRAGEDAAKRTSRLQPLVDQQLGEARQPLLVLLAAAAALLLVACANVAALLMADVRSRRVELAVRTALGADRWRVARQLLFESLALAAVAGALGLFMCRWLTPVLVALAPERLPRLDSVAVDGRVLGFALLLSFATALICGAGAALTTTSGNLAAALADGGRGGARRYRAQHTLVISEIALAFALLAGASLFAETVRRMGAQPIGFEPSNLVVVSVRAPRSMSVGVAPAALAARTSDLTARLAAVPGVVAAAGTASAPFGGGYGSNGIEIEGKTITPAPSARRQIVTETFFSTMRLPVRRGRTFQVNDPSSPKLAVVSEEFERRYMDGQAIGKRFRLNNDMMEVIGVVANVRQVELTDETEPTFFALSRQLPTWSVNQHVVRCADSPEGVIPALREAVRTYDSRLVVSTTFTMDALIARSMAEERYRALLSTLFGVTALVLCAIGVYGLLAREVTDRKGEIGLRMALGARPADVLRLIGRQGLMLLAGGLLAGIPVALGATQLIRSLLFGVTPGAPGVYLLIAAVLMLAAGAATLVPARRATRVDPSALLRGE